MKTDMLSVLEETRLYHLREIPWEAIVVGLGVGFRRDPLVAFTAILLTAGLPMEAGETLKALGPPRHLPFD
jgi:hypothetical protein